MRMWEAIVEWFPLSSGVSSLNSLPKKLGTIEKHLKNGHVNPISDLYCFSFFFSSLSSVPFISEKLNLPKQQTSNQNIF